MARRTTCKKNHTILALFPGKPGHRKVLYHRDLQPVLGVGNHSLALDSQARVKIPGIKDCLGVFNGYLCSGGVYNGNKLFKVKAILP